MRWLIIALFLVGFTPIRQKHSTLVQVDEEFSNIENDLQSQQFVVFKTTPALSDLKDGQIVVHSSATVNGLFWRKGQEIYSISGSCVTVRR